MKEITIFCFPYAGGSASYYHTWRKHFNLPIKLFPVEFAGRGTRYQDKLYESFDEAVNDIYSRIKEHINEGPYALFGHSMGSWLVYELSCKIREAGKREPVHIFFSGQEAPHINKCQKILHKLPESEFIEEICKLGGTPKEFFEHKELQDLFVPILRSDYQIIETRKHIHRDDKLDCDISVLNGLEDDMTVQDLCGWKEYTNKNCKIYNFKGGHFFIHDNLAEIVQLINTVLLKNADIEKSTQMVGSVK